MPERRGGATLLLFLACFVLGQADKQVMGLLSLPVQASFQLSDTQLGLLQGVAFAMAYAIGGIPIAHLLDRGRRVRIAAICVALWSVATILCGVAGSFAALFALRAATAIAEAGLPPAFFSILSQSGEARRISRATTIFMLAPFVGGGLVLVLGGAVLRAAAASGFLSLEPWRVVFFAVGVPGLLLAPLLSSFAREPQRPAASMVVERPKMRAVLATIFVESEFLRLYYLALLAFTVFLYAVVAWYPACLVRQFGLATSEAGRNAGLIYLAAGVLGTLAAGLVATLRRDADLRATVRGYLVIALVLVPVATLLSHVASLQVSLGLYAVYAFLSAMIVASMAVPIQLALANTMLARGFAIFSLLTSALAGSAGPLLVGLLSERTGLAAALSVTGGGSMLLAAALFLLAWRAAREAYPRAEAAARAACS